MNIYNLRNFLLSKGITVSKCKKADLVKLAKAAINLGLEDNKKTRGPYKNKFNFDPYPTGDHENLSKNELKEIQEKLCQFGCVAGSFITSDTENELDDLSETLIQDSKNLDPVPFIFEKVRIFEEQGGTGCTNFIEQYSVSEEERIQLESQTKGQGSTWKVQRRGLVTSTKLKEVYTKQRMIEKGKKTSGETLAARLLEKGSLERYSKLPAQIEYGRTNEHEARKEYYKLMSTTH
eukprot:gene1643-1826_t